MPSEHSSDVKFEIGHVLFIDIVGYSKLLINEQSDQIQKLKEIMRGTEQFRLAKAEGSLLRLPTGDGGALVFRTTPEAPVLCAMEIGKELKKHPELHVRMGIHSGPVNEITDLNEQANIAGAGINTAQRVMDCGDAGHILLSKHVADDLEHYPRWQPFLHPLGECEVKHGARIGVVNLHNNEVGNPKAPRKLQAVQQHRARTRWAAIIVALLLLSAIVAAFVIVSKKSAISTSAVPEKSIAVLPFENLSDDKSNAYFADGIQEEILTRLAKIADLKVISRTSTQRYQSKPGNLGEIAKQLGVANILEGSVQKAADQVRVNVQLINAQTDSHLWADTYDRKLTDIFGVESEIAKGIAESLRAKLTGREEQALAVKPTNNPEAYDAYLRGLAFEARNGAWIDLLMKAIGFYEQAVQLDPKFALAWARLSRAEALLYFRNARSGDNMRDAAKKALENAQKLEPNSAETLLALGCYQRRVLADDGLAKTTFTRVSKMLPGNSEIISFLATIALDDGHWDQSIAYFEKARALDPLNAELLADTAWTYGVLRQFPMALKLYDQALDISPNDPDVMASKAGIYQAQGNLEQAARCLSQITAQTPGVLESKINQFAFERNYREAIRLVQALLARLQTEGEMIAAGGFESETAKATHASLQLYLAMIQLAAGDSTGAKFTAEQARNTLEGVRKTQSDHPAVLLSLAQANALMGEKDSGRQAAQRAIMLFPVAKDALEKAGLREQLALVQTSLGENSRAISTLAELLHTPYSTGAGRTPITPALLRLDPIWDPLRGDPAFQKLCEEKQP